MTNSARLQGKVTLFGADGSETEYDYDDMLNVERD